jgi:hypothetical protein
LFNIINNLISEKHIDIIRSEICNFFLVRECSEIEQALAGTHNLNDTRIRLNKIQAIVDIGDHLLPSIEIALGCKLKKHPVSGVRIVTRDLFTQAPWHQDEGTWRHREELSDLSPITCWVPILATTNNTLEFTEKGLKHLLPHERDGLGRAYCNLSTELSDKTITISPVLGSGYVFDSLQPHRSFFNDLTPSDAIRISVDFRYHKLI